MFFLFISESTIPEVGMKWECPCNSGNKCKEFQLNTSPLKRTTGKCLHANYVMDKRCTICNGFPVNNSPMNWAGFKKSVEVHLFGISRVQGMREKRGSEGSELVRKLG